VKDGIEYSSPERVSAWWNSAEPWNIGVATGRPSGLYVIDLDGADGVAEWWALELSAAPAPTLVARTGGGGQHRYYRLPDGVDLGNTAKRLAGHIDTRGTGGYVLMPPSNHHSGSCYAWGPKAQIALLPQWVIHRLTNGHRRSAPAAPSAPAVVSHHASDLALRILRDEAGLVARAVNGTRNHELFRHACSAAQLAWGGEMPVELVVDEMRQAGLQAGLPLHEIDKTLISAVRAARDQPRRIMTREEATI
jgi:hypothetical protein